MLDFPNIRRHRQLIKESDARTLRVIDDLIYHQSKYVPGVNQILGDWGEVLIAGKKGHEYAQRLLQHCDVVVCKGTSRYGSFEVDTRIFLRVDNCTYRLRRSWLTLLAFRERVRLQWFQKLPDHFRKMYPSPVDDLPKRIVIQKLSAKELAELNPEQEQKETQV